MATWRARMALGRGRLLCGAATAAALLVGLVVITSRSLASVRHAPADGALAPLETTFLQQSQDSDRLGSFLVIGDWGWDGSSHGNCPNTWCQRQIAEVMLEKMNELGDVKFIINVGDSFYPDGVRSKWDRQWDQKWRNVYDKKLRSVPWYSVYGNHDYHHDPCVCNEDPKACAQHNADYNNRNFFYMPNHSWNIQHPELGLEVVALDFNEFENGWNRTGNISEYDPPGDCRYTPCHAACLRNMKNRAKEALNLFHERRSKTTAKNLIVFSHYPTDYLWMIPPFVNGLQDDWNHHVAYFAGHRHNVNKLPPWKNPNNNWLVGGGGGWSCDGGSQGFVVGEISNEQELSTYPVLIDKHKCCPTHTTTTTTPLPIPTECGDAEDGSLCYRSVKWAMHTGIATHEEWYPGLTRDSSVEEFQKALHDKGLDGCPLPCKFDTLGSFFRFFR